MVTDFAADVPFAQVMDKLVEHYGIVLDESTIRRVTLHHAERMHVHSRGSPLGLPDKAGDAETFIAQIDGSMVPIVCNEPMQDAPPLDAQGAHAAPQDAGTQPQQPGKRRQVRRTQWQETKLSLAHAQGSTRMFYGATLQGDANRARGQLRACAKRAGLGAEPRVHALEDGAVWIVQQVRQ